MASEMLYEQFTPTERLTLVLEAMGRRDDAEADKLARTCPRKTYTMGDAAYADRLEAASDVMLVALVDLRCACGRLEVLHGILEDLEELDRWHHVNAAMAFMDGVRYARGKPSLEEADPPSEEAVEEYRAEAGETVQEAIAAAVAIREDPEFSRRLELVKGWSQKVTDRTRRILVATAESVAQGLVSEWEALDRFSRSRLGVGAKTLLAAWWPGAAQNVSEMLGRYKHLSPREDEAAEYARLLVKMWDGRFGG